MCEQSDIPEEIGEAIAETENVMRGVTDLSKRIDVQIDICSMLINDPELVRTWANVGDYEAHLEGEKVTWNYRPKIIKGDGYDKSLYQDDIDPARIISFTMPPIPDTYDSNSDPTHSVGFEIRKE